MKKFIAALLAGLTLFTLVGCSGGSKADSSTPKDYSQIIHDARSDEDNEYDMIFTKGEDGKFTAIDGYSAEYEPDQLNEEIRDILMPPLNLEDDQYTAFAASISSMMVRSYAVAIVKPAEGKTDEVKAALEAYVASEQQSMEHYLEDQYLVAKAATVTVAPTGEVVLVCAEDHDTILANIEAYRQANHATIVIVSHSMEDVARLADRLVVVSHGTLPYIGTPREVFSHGAALEELGLGVPAMNRVFSRVRAMGVDIDPAVYTVEQAKAAFLAAWRKRKEGK